MTPEEALYYLKLAEKVQNSFQEQGYSPSDCANTMIYQLINMSFTIGLTLEDLTHEFETNYNYVKALSEAGKLIHDRQSDDSSSS